MKIPKIAIFTAQCRDEAFAIIDIHVFILKRANASPLHGVANIGIVEIFQKTKVLQKLFLEIARTVC